MPPFNPRKPNRPPQPNQEFEELFLPERVSSLLLTGGYRVLVKRGTYEEREILVPRKDHRGREVEQVPTEFFFCEDGEHKVMGKVESIIAMWVHKETDTDVDGEDILSI